MLYELPPLSYPYDALEPWIDTETMHVHHDKHHQAYVDKTNTILDGLPKLKDMDLEQIFADLQTLDIDNKAKTLIRNFGGGHSNHSFFWQVMGPTKNVDQELVAEIAKQWGSVEAFKEKFNEQSLGFFGSGWTWLVRNQKGELELYALPNQDSPLMLGHEPIFCLDLWEHAYYLKYKNLRVDYIKAWWNVLKFLQDSTEKTNTGLTTPFTNGVVDKVGVFVQSSSVLSPPDKAPNKREVSCSAATLRELFNPEAAASVDRIALDADITIYTRSHSLHYCEERLRAGHVTVVFGKNQWHLLATCDDGRLHSFGQGTRIRIRSAIPPLTAA